MRTMCIEICFEWLSSMDQATKLEFVVEMLQLRRLLDKTVAAQRHRATAKRLKREGFPQIQRLKRTGEEGAGARTTRRGTDTSQRARDTGHARVDALIPSFNS